jgi:two-component system, NarL family, response regulator LiaR
MTTTPLRPVRLAVLNDFDVIVAGVTAILAPYRERVVVLEETTGRAAYDGVDVVLYDTFGSPRRVGDEVWRELIRSPARLVVYSWSRDPRVVEAALEAGADGFVHKSVQAPALVAELERVHRGRVVTPAEPAGRVPLPDAPGADWPGAEHGLSMREAEMLAQIMRGRSNQEIAAASYLSINSVKTYIRTAYRKIGVTTRPHAILWGIAHGFEVDQHAGRVRTG